MDFKYNPAIDSFSPSDPVNPRSSLPTAKKKTKLVQKLASVKEKNKKLISEKSILLAKLDILTSEKEMHISQHANEKKIWSSEKEKLKGRIEFERKRFKLEYNNVLRMIEEVKLAEKSSEFKKKASLEWNKSQTGKKQLKKKLSNSHKLDDFESEKKIFHFSRTGNHLLKVEELFDKIDKEHRRLKKRVKQIENSSSTPKSGFR